jgi:hypothetical protein
MGAPTDRVRLLKNESPTTGGTQDDVGFPSQLNPNQDGISVQGIFLQKPKASGPIEEDELVYITRNVGGDIVFIDVTTGVEKTLTELLAGAGGVTESSHKVLRQLIHFIDDGPAEGFASGAYKETTGTVTPTAIVWYTDSGKTDKIVERLITWSGVVPTVDKWKIYDTDGSTVLWTISDAITSSGIFETSRTRTITAGDA